MVTCRKYNERSKANIEIVTRHKMVIQVNTREIFQQAVTIVS